jgi:peptidoglycan/xylan/chitin deacetylase (PgdA/CDA1 family)
MWVDTMDFTRRVERETGKRIRWTYFINTCYYDPSVEGSWIGKAHSREEVIARTALTQQAINEGHEIGNHTVRHQDGSEWTEEQWRKEIQEFHDFTDNNLFKPLYDSLTGEQIFPKWPDGTDVADGAVGSICETDSECNSGICLPITADTSYCSQRCNSNNPCPDGSACGAPDWNTSRDVCVPLPEFPVEYQGEELFDADGYANLDHPALETYPIKGFRAPQLGHNSALFKVLTDFDYDYDTSKVLHTGPPQRVRHSGDTFDSLYEFALMRNSGSATIPMDYNYKYGDYSGDRMLQDYRQSVLDAYEVRGRQPWNIGHHFALWKRGAYWQAMQDVFEWSAKGCPDDDGRELCPETEFPTFGELAAIIDAINEDKSDDVSSESGDIFADVDNPEEDHESGDCMCGEGEEISE